MLLVWVLVFVAGVCLGALLGGRLKAGFLDEFGKLQAYVQELEAKVKGYEQKAAAEIEGTAAAVEKKL